MKTFQDLTIEGKPEDLKQFLQDFPDPATGWKRKEDKTYRLPAQGVVFTAVETPKDTPLPAATLYLTFNGEGKLIVSNIVPVQAELSTEEYNRILQVFYANCVRARAEVCGLIATLTRGERFIEDTLSPHNMKLLLDFSRLATKSAGSSHPLDKERWLAFIAASVRDGEILDATILDQWLVEDGWPAYIAKELVIDYQFGVELLQRFEQEKDKAGAIR